MNNITQDTKSPNFVLKGFASVQVGVYFLVSAYLLKKMVENFLVDDTFMMFMSVQLIEYFAVGVLFFLFLFSSFALFYSSRRRARKVDKKIWNAASKKRFWIYLIHFIVGITILLLTYSNGLYNLLGSVGLVLYAFMLISLSGYNKAYYLFAGLSVLLAVMSFIIPTYWYSSMLLMGVAHFAYGIVKRV